MTMDEIDEKLKKDAYQQVKDKVEYKQFLKDIDEFLNENDDNPFLSSEQVLLQIIEKYADNKNIQQTHNQVQKIADLIKDNGGITIQGRLLAISNIKTFKTKAGREGKVANLTVEDDTGKIRVVMWTVNMKYMNRINEGNILKISNVDIVEGYTGDLEAQMRGNSTIQVMPEEVGSDLPKYEENMTKIADIKEDGEYNLIARIIKISSLKEIPKDDKTLELITLTLMDETGDIEFNLWNKDTKLAEDLDLEENDTIKIMKARASFRYNQMSLSNSWNGRIIKEEYDLPEYHQQILKINDAKVQENVTIIGVIKRLFDTIEFDKNDGSKGKVKSIIIEDDTGEIRATLWNKETEIAMDKGNIIKIEDANIEEDTYNEGLRLNTGWNASIKINPEIDDELEMKLKSINTGKITPINDALDIDIPEGREIDVIGRILAINNMRDFERMDGTIGQLRSIEIGDGTGIIRVTLWDKKADINQSLEDLIKIENAKTRLGQGKMELSVGNASHITTPSEAEIAKIPSYAEIQNERFHEKTLEELEDHETDVKLLVRVMDIGPVNTFARDNGSDGKVRSVYIADKTGQLQASFWDEDTDIKFGEAAAIAIENPRVQKQDGQETRITIASDTNVRQATQDEAQLIPSIHELKNKIYPEKVIEDIDDTDRHIKVKASIEEIDGEDILIPMCPTCHKAVHQEEEGYVCDVCGEQIDEPEYLLIIKTILVDETGSIKTTFFGPQAEELISMKLDEIIDIFDKTGDESSLADKIGDLEDHEVTIIADASFNEYEEDIRLTVKKTEVVL